MGCDIHPHIEVKIKGYWHHYSAPPMKRWYAVFERICGVRGDVRNAIAPPRGLPLDMSEITLLCYHHDQAGAHSETWLSGKEFDDLIKWVERNPDGTPHKNADRCFYQHRQIGYLFGCCFGRDNRENGIEDVRFVCWFDN
jgi:hypothetical protein